ncbi:hypothetical protein B566_EDAN012154 [Ephemera danica]|nr:hypothetical protein B566_EDAN012154 [Ephemera danica]
MANAREREGSVSSRASARPYAVLPGLEQSRLAEQLQDSRERALKLDMELKALKTKHKTLESSHGDLKNKLKTAQETADKYQKLYKECKNNTNTGQKMSALKSELEQCQMDLKERSQEVTELSTRLTHSQKQLKESRAETQQWKMEAHDQEQMYHSLRNSCDMYRKDIETLQDVTRHRDDQHKQDLLRIQNLEQQVREMEQIIRRESGGDGSTDTPSAALVEMLESRVRQLSEQLTEREHSAKIRVQDMEARYNAMKNSYECHMERLSQKVENSAVERDTNRTESSRSSARSPSRRNEQRSDEHLVATVRGLQVELASKEKELVKITRELHETKTAANRMRQGKPSSMKNKDAGGRKCMETAILTAEVAELQQEMRQLRDQINKLTSTNQRLTSDLAASNNALTSLAAQSQQANV